MDSDPEPDGDLLRCRLCLAQEVDELISLFCKCDSQNLLVAEMVRDLMRIGCPLENDGLPQYVCGDCLERLDKACTLRQQCITVDRTLKRKLLQGVSIRESDDSCRICCKKEVDEFVSVYCICAGVDKLVADMIRTVFGVARPTECDGLPQEICGNCFEELSAACSFRTLLFESNLQLRKNLAVQQNLNEKMKEVERLDQAEENWYLPGQKRKRLPVKRKVEVPRMDEVDPFIYLDSPDVNAERLLPLFSILEDAAYYDKLLFEGIICCCGKLLVDDCEFQEHLSLFHTEKEAAWSRICCKDCNKRFKLTGDLAEHIENREKKQFYRCKICNILTKERIALQMHFEFTRFHPILDASEDDRLAFEGRIETLFEPDCRCCGCDEQFADGQSLLQHVKDTHQAEQENFPLFMCTICYNSFSEKQTLTKHQLAYIGTTSYVCREEECQFKSDQRTSAKKHAESGQHCSLRLPYIEEEKPQINEFFCCFSFCKEISRTQQELEEHCHTVHGEQRETNILFADPDVAGERVCPLCCRYFPKDHLFLTHIRMQTDRKHICSTCGLKYHNREMLNRHEKRHEKEVPDKLRHECDKCDAVYAGKGSLLKHVMRVHDKVFSHICKTCGKGFVCKAAMQQHEMNNHVDAMNRPYKCTICQLSFGIKPLLVRHMITHSDDRPYQCSYCEKTYRHIVDCKRHEKSIHLNDKRFRCELCDAIFIRDRDLRLHQTSHTKTKLFSCLVDGCVFSTNVAKQLKDHNEEEHEDTY